MEANSSVDLDEAAFKTLFDNFKAHYEVYLDSHDVIYAILMGLGVSGAMVALGTMLTSQQMRSPSFAYHRALMTANLVFCANWFLLKSVDSFLSEYTLTQAQYVFSSRVACWYSGFGSRLVSSSCGYVVLYVTLVLGLDRCLALSSPLAYLLFNTKRVSQGLIAGAAAAAVFVHSWFPLFARRTQELRLRNATFYTWAEKRDAETRRLELVNDGVNGLVRVAYPILLSVLTGLAMYLFMQRAKRRKSSFNIRRSRKDRRRERSLFLLLLSFVLLAFVQVIPRETKRVWDNVLSSNVVMGEVKNVSLPLHFRLTRFHQMLCKDLFLNAVLNLCVGLDRSLGFFLCVLLNPTFRKSVVAFVGRVLCRRCVPKDLVPFSPPPITNSSPLSRSKTILVNLPSFNVTSSADVPRRSLTLSQLPTALRHESARNLLQPVVLGPGARRPWHSEESQWSESEEDESPPSRQTSFASHPDPHY